MKRVECPFCHASVLQCLYAFHEWRHTRRRRDGQMVDHVTVKESERYIGSLVGVPRCYYHTVCRSFTGMPDEIIPSYLVNPFLYNEATFCCGCGDYVQMQECFWKETNENLLAYNKKLRREKLGKEPLLHVQPEVAEQTLKLIQQQDKLPADVYLRFSLVHLPNHKGCFVSSEITSDYDPLNDWKGEFFGLSVVVDLGDSARVVYGQVAAWRRGKVSLIRDPGNHCDI